MQQEKTKIQGNDPSYRSLQEKKKVQAPAHLFVVDKQASNIMHDALRSSDQYTKRMRR